MSSPELSAINLQQFSDLTETHPIHVKMSSSSSTLQPAHRKIFLFILGFGALGAVLCAIMLGVIINKLQKCDSPKLAMAHKPKSHRTPKVATPAPRKISVPPTLAGTRKPSQITASDGAPNWRMAFEREDNIPVMQTIDFEDRDNSVAPYDILTDDNAVNRKSYRFTRSQ